MFEEVPSLLNLHNEISLNATDINRLYSEHAAQ